MNINAFITMYNQRMKNRRDYTKDMVLTTVQDLIKPKAYLSFNEKLQLIDRTFELVERSKHPTADRYRYFTMVLINAYTVLEVNDVIKAFDLLSENRLLDIILHTFEYEYKVCTNLMSMCLEDRIILEGGCQ